MTEGISQETTMSPIDKDQFTNYFFEERFTRPVSPLGWSIIGPIIEHRALKQPLRYMGFLALANKKLVHLIDGYPYAEKNTYRTMFQIVPRKLVTQDKLNTFMRKEDLKDFNFSLLIKKFPFLLFHMLIDLNWFPPYHFFVWKSFKRSNIKFYENFKTKLLYDKSVFDLIHLVGQQNKRTDTFLKLHRWSFIYSEIFYGILKGIIRMWIPCKKVDEDIEIAEKLCSGFKENVTAEMDRELQKMAQKIAKKMGSDYHFGDNTEDKIMLADFISRNGHRSESLDIYYPTWAENPIFVINVINQLLPTIKGKVIKEIGELEQQREEMTEHCKYEIKKHSSIFSFHLKRLVFNIALQITQRFMVLREVQRNQWQMILSQKRRVILQIARHYAKEGILKDRDDIFFMTYKELKLLLKGKENIKQLQQSIDDRKLEMNSNLLKEQLGEKISTKRKKRVNGIGASAGKIRGKVVVLNGISEMKKLKQGDILVTKIVDSSWTPIFNVISGLITEVGGMLSHGAVVARELRIPAIVGIKNATQLFPSNTEIEMDGKSGLVVVL